MAASTFVYLAQQFSNKYYCNKLFGINRTFKRVGLQWLSSNKHIVIFFSNKPQTACNNTDNCNRSCEIDTVSLKYGSLQVHPCNNNTIIEKINGSNRCRQITDFIQYIHFWNQGGITIINYDISLVPLLLCKSIVNFAWLQLFFDNRKLLIHQMGGCNWNCELTQYPSNTCQIYCIYAIHGCKCSFKKNLFIEKWMAAATFVK